MYRVSNALIKRIFYKRNVSAWDRTVIQNLYIKQNYIRKKKHENSDELFSCFFCVIEYYSVMFYDTKKLSGQAPYLYLFFFDIKI